MLHLHADHGEGRRGRALGMQIGPGVDRDGAIDRMRQAGRAVGSAVRACVPELETPTVFVGPTATGIQARRTAKDAVLRQADHQIRIQVRLGELRHVIRAIQRDYRSWCSGWLASACLSNLADRHLGRGPSRGTAALHVQGQDPTAIGLWHLHQPLVGPGRDHPLLGLPGNGRCSQVRAGLVAAAGLGQCVPSTTHSGRSPGASTGSVA